MSLHYHGIQETLNFEVAGGFQRKKDPTLVEFTMVTVLYVPFPDLERRLRDIQHLIRVDICDRAAHHQWET